ncbi:translation initiation factor IF-2 [Carnobacterium inhibens]|uniref:Translation initiation factor IF-2 n=2 Tax=Carnobacterium inhibens TaxID=147709 RepID=U5SC39_9LACT|nr:translation initiation factor IF-2 [Carnobacterium inhibens]AGY81638.1 translation initiation factor IF-2 [Carnobacterium inhibens subsp. gilichinskyi]MBC9824791.1 translation initiation factor IF-2 [Carnobacterium inhibens]MCM3512605.1 translation initiation factor IF-2 [Carnobacterium inhibens]
MAKKRVYEYAKELDVPTKSVIDKAKELGIDYNSHMSAMDDKQVEKLNTIFVSNNKSNAVSKNNDPKKATSTSSTKNQKGGNPITNQKNQSNQSQPNRPASKETNAVTSKPKNTTTVKPASTSKPAAKPAASAKPKTQTSSQTAQSGTGNQAPQRAAAAPAGNKNKRTGNRPFNRGSVGTHGGFNKRKRKGKKGETKPVAPPVARKFKELPEVLVYTDGMTVADISKKIYREPAEIIKKLFMLGVVATLNQSLGKEAIELLAEEYGIATEEKVQVDVSDLDVYFEQESAEENLTTRPPVVTIMGHVDHGKTTLLDSLRNTKVSLGEAGGITQHIGAYQVDVDGKVITFLDTPGHAAFTTMRARGADVTDITIIVVAADDGVMPQTVEAINHAKAAEVPIIVAVNKVDKPDANPERVMQELTEYGLVPESWGGDTIFVEISAKFGQNLDELLEMILLVAEVEDLKADPKRLALGSVIEARLDKSKGPIATLLVQEGTLNVGDPIVVGNTYGRVRVMVNENGRRVKHAGPSAPVEITGLNTAPQAGDQFVVFEDEKTARAAGETREKKAMAEQRSATNRVTIDNLFSSLQEGELKEVNVIIKADVQGSAEALSSSLQKIDVEGVRVKMIHTAVGAINESDITLAAASNGIIIGFNVRPTPQAKIQAEQEQVDIRLHRIIYNAIDEIETAMKGLLDPEYEEKVTGQAVVRETFKVSKVGTIAGGFVTDGYITRSSSIRLIRDNIVIFEGELASLKRFKDDAKEVKKGFECGFMIKDYNEVQVDDIIEAYEMVEIKRK